MKYTIEIDTEEPTIVEEVLAFPKEKVIEVLNYITCATSIIINEQKQENEQLKRKIGVMQSCHFNSCIGCNDKKCEVKNEN